jgi:RHS repeat-associated protein
MERDEESGLGYHSARYHAPWLGRWCSADPSGARDGVNLYSYVSNRPTRLIDKTGKAGGAGSWSAAEMGKQWEAEIVNTLKSKFAAVDQVTVKATIDGKEVISVLDALAKTKEGFVVIESKLNPTTLLSDAQKALMGHVMAGGKFTIIGEAKEEALRTVLKVAPDAEISAIKYIIVNQGNASEILKSLKAIGPDEIATIAKGGVLEVLTKKEAEEVYKIVHEGGTTMEWKKGIEIMRGRVQDAAAGAEKTVVAKATQQAEKVAVQSLTDEAEKVVVQSLTDEAEKVVVQSLTKFALNKLGKAALASIPVIGALPSVASAAKNYSEGKTLEAELDVAGIVLDPVDWFRAAFGLAELYNAVRKEVDDAISSPDVTREFAGAVWGGGGGGW